MRPGVPRSTSRLGFADRSPMWIAPSLSFMSTLKTLGIISQTNLEKIRKMVAKRTFEAHDLMLRSYYAVKFSSSSQVDFSRLVSSIDMYNNDVGKRFMK
jgi:hypothetical protein